MTCAPKGPERHGRHESVAGKLRRPRLGGLRAHHHGRPPAAVDRPAAHFALALIAIVILVAGGVVFFGVHLPSQWGGFVLSVLLAIAAMFAIGLVITAVAPSPQIAALAGTILLYPLLFFAGMWTPKKNLSPTFQHVADYTPLGAAVQAMDAAMQGHFPPTRPLLVMAGYAVVCGVVAIRLFRWE
jgi:ABC-2 type transport system permease protein